MPVIDRERWRTLEPLLDRALDLSDDERAAWLDELRSSSPDIAAELNALLSGEAAADARRFLAEPLEGKVEGLTLGAYTLERPLGHGGMGSVWLARRSDGRFEGKAAVKLLNLAFLSPGGRERFRREGSALARLTHPGIARLLDAGVSPSGQPYLVLEHVEGERVDAFADARGLPIEERVRLFLQVLAAVGHAHANLIVHRDLKPSNILVTGDGAVKLLDFGIAKLLDAEESAAGGALTMEGMRALTPEYAAPEQVRGDAITTATDIYGLGLLLYTLLVGRHPYDLTSRSAAELDRVIASVEPLRPSAAFAPGARPPGGTGGTGGGGSGGSVPDDRVERARVRGGTPERIAGRLRGDLDAIVMKALRKEPERRYPSVAALADDLERFLAGRAVAARPESAGYRVRRFVDRHRGLVAGTIALLALLAGVAIRERSLRARAEAETRRAEAIRDYLVSVFHVADPYATTSPRGEDVTARALLDRGAARIDSTLAGQPDAQAQMRVVLGQVYSELGLYDKAESLLRRALEQRRALYGARHVAVAEAMDGLGTALLRQDRFDEAEPLLREALAQYRSLRGNRDSATAASVTMLATLFQERHDFAAAEPLFREALDLQRAVHGPDHEQVATALNDLGLLLFQKGDYDHAEPLYRQALAIYERRLGEDHPLTSQSLHNLAQVQQFRGQIDDAISLYRRALAAKRKTLGNAHPSVTVNLNNLGILLAREKGELVEAEALVREALALDRQLFGERHGYVAASLNNLGAIMRLKGDFVDAEKLFRQALAIDRAIHGDVHGSVALDLNSIATTRHLQGDVGGAVALYRQSLAQYARLMGEEHPYYTSVSLNLARALRDQGSTAEAERVLRTALGRLDAAKPGQRPQLIVAQVLLGATLTDEGRAREALPMLDSALAMTREKYPSDDWHTGDAKLALGAALLGAGQRARAEPLLREAYAVLEKHRRTQPLLFERASVALRRLSSAR